MEKEHYVVLVSNSREGNTSSEFTTILPTPLELYKLTGTHTRWCVGLSEITTTFSWDQIRSPQKVILNKIDGSVQTFILPVGNYRNHKSLLANLHNIFSKSRKRRQLASLKKIDISKNKKKDFFDHTKKEATATSISSEETVDKISENKNIEKPKHTSFDSNNKSKKQENTNNKNVPGQAKSVDETESSNTTKKTKTVSKSKTADKQESEKSVKNTSKVFNEVDKTKSIVSSISDIKTRLPDPPKRPQQPVVLKQSSDKLIPLPTKTYKAIPPKEDEATLPEERITPSEVFEKYGIRFKYDKENYHFSVEIDTEIIKSVELDKELTYIMGFENSVISNSCVSKYIADFQNNFNNIYCYSSVVEPTILGNTRSDILRVISLTDTPFGSVLSKQFPSIQYRPVRTNSISSIDIRLLDEQGTPLKHHFGTTVVVLHFIRDN